MKGILLTITAGTLVLVSLAACSVGAEQPGGDRGIAGQGGMMGGGGGMMGGGMMGPGMMGGWGGYGRGTQLLTPEQAFEAAFRYLDGRGKDLELTEVMEFAWNFYAEVDEKSTGIHAMELLIDKYSGQVYPEMGPNMMWNTKYGMMGSPYAGQTGAMPVTPEKAKTLAQRFLDSNSSGLTADEPEAFYGYYTLHTLRDKQIEGMLSVNGSTGQVWYHSWHGPFIGMQEIERPK